MTFIHGFGMTNVMWTATNVIRTDNKRDADGFFQNDKNDEDR
jgi:hypothetical protein